jgi:hypothetical protein
VGNKVTRIILQAAEKGIREGAFKKKLKGYDVLYCT